MRPRLLGGAGPSTTRPVRPTRPARAVASARCSSSGRAPRCGRRCRAPRGIRRWRHSAGSRPASSLRMRSEDSSTAPQRSAKRTRDRGLPGSGKSADQRQPHRSSTQVIARQLAVPDRDAGVSACSGLVVAQTRHLGPHERAVGDVVVAQGRGGGVAGELGVGVEEGRCPGRRGRAVPGPSPGTRRRRGRRRGAGGRRSRGSPAPAARRGGRTRRRRSGRRVRPPPAHRRTAGRGDRPDRPRTALPAGRSRRRGRRGAAHPGTRRVPRRWPANARAALPAAPSTAMPGPRPACVWKAAISRARSRNVVPHRCARHDERRQSPVGGHAAHHEHGLVGLVRTGEPAEAQVHVRGDPAVELQLTAQGRRPPIRRGEVEERGPHRLLGLVGAVTDQDHHPDVGLGDHRRAVADRRAFGVRHARSSGLLRCSSHGCRPDRGLPALVDGTSVRRAAGG